MIRVEIVLSDEKETGYITFQVPGLIISTMQSFSPSPCSYTFSYPHYSFALYPVVPLYMPVPPSRFCRAIRRHPIALFNAVH